MVYSILFTSHSGAIMMKTTHFKTKLFVCSVNSYKRNLSLYMCHQCTATLDLASVQRNGQKEAMEDEREFFWPLSKFDGQTDCFNLLLGWVP